ncbi:MAG: helix-hairpin-helix domain-containing protein, partial [Acidaminococcaceae bacterium]|nr:helix-hairpin-helix domain-containing protein [Acidaminococcaceae bacterium]
VVESCVNHVGVELNTASPALLGYVAGISSTVAKNIITWRNENGRFHNRKELLKVPRLGPAAFTQCAGFLRIANGTDPLDNTPVHPESYALTEIILAELGCKKENCASPSVQLAAAKADPKRIADHLQAGLPTVTDILQALAKPGRDPREDSPAPMRRKNVTKLSDLQIGTIVKGTVRNVVDFGCFVDIGLKINGLIHRSELSNRRFKHPLDIVSTGDIVDVMIISIDEARGRIGLSLKQVPGNRSDSK